ncbi:MAG: protein jag [Chloroflexi bacterium]|nr:protein jag [Chloroflexota bacterium]
MESLEVSAKTVKEAIAQALAQLGKTRDEVEISILSEGSRGILGIGGEDARILVSPRPQLAATKGTTEIAEAAKQVVEDLLRFMHVAAEVTIREAAPNNAEETPPVTLDVNGADLGILIGRRGETLSALQFITNLIVGKRQQRWTRIIVDVEDYRGRRERLLQGLAIRMAEKAVATGQAVALEAMSAYERRIVHLALHDYPHVTTQSSGQGEERKVIILPKSKPSVAARGGIKSDRTVLPPEGV